MTPARSICLTAAILLIPMAAFGQHIVSARAGLIHYVEGQVLLNEQPVVAKASQFSEVREGEYLRTGEGRCEVLLTPGIFLRLGENSQIQMTSSRLSDVRFKLLAGSAEVEADELKDHAVTVDTGSAQVRLEHAGLYRLDAAQGAAPRLRVFSGEALVTASDSEYRVKAKKELELSGDFQQAKFDPESTDALDRWSKRRASYLSAANVSSSSMAYYGGSGSYGGYGSGYGYGYGYGYGGYGFGSSNWVWNPVFGMFTFLPYSNVAWSPYGYGFYSPATVFAYYIQPRMYGSRGSGGSPVLGAAGRSNSTGPALSQPPSGLSASRGPSMGGGMSGGGISGGGLSRGGGGGGSFHGAAHR